MAKLTEEKVKQIYSFHSEGFSDRQIAKKTEINHRTVGAYLRHKNLKSNIQGPKKANYIGTRTINCSKCLIVQFEDNFLLCRRNKPYPYRLSYCNDCRRLQNLKNINSDGYKVLRDIYLRTQQRCLKKGIKFHLNYEDLKYIYEEQVGKCFYSDTKMDLIRGLGSNWNACTIDKVVPELGYIKSNIVLCTRRFNTVKNDLSLLEIKTHMPFWYEKLMKTTWLKLEYK